MKKELWLRLKHYRFDHLVPPQLLDHVAAAFGGSDASTKAFASKLSRKLHWTPAFSQRAIGEYRKFLYLGAVSDFPVTPSKVIDQVWHEHLLFSKGYREFCRDVLRRDFDHNPELVPFDGQTGAFMAQYDATIALYFAEFHMEPPADIWGRPKFASNRGEPAKTVDRKKEQRAGSGSSGDDGPLYLMFTGPAGHTGHSPEAMPEFGGGGEFSGGGGGSEWGGSDASDASSASDSGSSCSSGCGGGE